MKILKDTEVLANWCAPCQEDNKNNKFCIVSRVMAGDIFRLLLYIDYDIPLVSSHLTSFAIFDYCSN